MPYAISQLTEAHLIAAEEEQGIQFVESLRKFLLNDRFTVLDLRATAPVPLSIVPFSVIEERYEYRSTFANEIYIAERI